MLSFSHSPVYLNASFTVICNFEPISLEFMYYLHWYLKKVTICLNCFLLLLPTFTCFHWRWHIYGNNYQNWPRKIYSIIIFTKIFETWNMSILSQHMQSVVNVLRYTLFILYQPYFKMRQGNAFFVGIQHPFMSTDVFASSQFEFYFLFPFFCL